MRRTLILCAGALLIAAPASAHEKHGKHAKVSKAKLTATEAVTAAGVRGHAQLVDGRKRDKVSLHMKGLEPGETYTWHVHEGDSCTADGAESPGWTYRELKVRPSGNANAKGRSSSFEGDGDFYVDVHSQDGTVIACGVLERKRGGKHKGHEKPGHGKPDGHHGHGKPDHD
jgi:hypothetical protein